MNSKAYFSSNLNFTITIIIITITVNIILLLFFVEKKNCNCLDFFITREVLEKRNLDCCQQKAHLPGGVSAAVPAP